MPKVKTNRVKYPEGWELVEPTLNELQAKMREAENDPHDGKRKCEALWPIFKIAHQKSRYIFDLYYRRKEISAELLCKWRLIIISNSSPLSFVICKPPPVEHEFVVDVMDSDVLS
ncbi:hypothetical protein E3N88_33105 [Mikania micrantha]|uniref:Uncharacterized protein n=1 Tax=Mikania micrantha TaxID=192012 RepID=A0A5N6MAB0_9ASTR|nr:hypothetical protein E3N88_33105 [Mikania micrantha]